MLPAFLLALREGMEVALILGIVLGVLRRTGRSHLAPAVWWGVSLAAALSLGLAFLIQAIGGTLEGAAEALFEGLVTLSAAAVLTWVIFWMTRHAVTLKEEIESNVRSALVQNGRLALFTLAFLAVLREGVELALFLSAAVLVTTQGRLVTLGALAGLGFAALLGVLLYRAALRLNLKRFFQVSSLLLLLFAAGLVGYGVHEWNEAGLIPPLIETLYDLRPWLDDGRGVGLLLKTLFGYNANPALSETLAYLAYLAIVGYLLRGQPRYPLNNASIA